MRTAESSWKKGGHISRVGSAGELKGEAAQLLGVSTKTVQTRWRNARLAVARLMEGTLPEV